MLYSSLLVAGLTLLATCTGQRNRPNFVFIMADDLGFNDVGYNNASGAITPTIDRLATQEGMIFDRFYVMPVCSPTRAALMTGRYPGRYGFQNGAISAPQPFGVPLDEIFLPEELHRAGYVNYLIGKHHLGFHQQAYSPTSRGFDHWLGHYGSGIGKWDSLHFDTYRGTDFWFKNLTDKNESCVPIPKYYKDQYLTDIYRDEAERVLMAHDKSKPFYLQLSFSVPHSPVEAKLSDMLKYSNKSYKHEIIDRDRIEYLSMVTAMDEAIGNTEAVLKSLGLWDNTILIFCNDNGGAPYAMQASNYPLRGGKTTLWEGGVRTNAFVSGGRLIERRRGTIYDGLVFITDWFETIVRSAGLEPTRPKPQLDSFDLSDLIKTRINPMPKRRHIVLNVDWELASGCNHTLNGEPMCGAVILDHYKLSIGQGIDLRTESRGGYSTGSWNFGSGARITCKSHANESNWDWVNSKRHCPYNAPEYKYTPCFYDLNDDPCETSDIHATMFNTSVYNEMVALLFEYKSLFVSALNNLHPEDPASDPRNHGRCWSPWL